MNNKFIANKKETYEQLCVDISNCNPEKCKCNKGKIKLQHCYACMTLGSVPTVIFTI